MDVLNEPSPQRKLGSMLLFAMDSSLRWNDENRPVQRSPMRTLLAALVLLLAFAGQAWAQGDGLNGSYWNFNVVANGNAFPTGAANRTRTAPTDRKSGVSVKSGAVRVTL